MRILLSVWIGLFAATAAVAQIIHPAIEFGAEEIRRSHDFYNRGLIRKSEQTLIRALEEYPETAARDRAIILKAQFELDQGNYNIADGRLAEFITKNPNSPFQVHAIFLRGVGAFEQGKYEIAEIYMNGAAAIAGEELVDREDFSYAQMRHEALYWQGVALAQEGKYQRAEPVFESCHTSLADGPFADDALFSLGIIQEVNRRYDSAVKYYSMVEKSYPYSNSLLASRIRQANNHLVLRNSSAGLLILENCENIAYHIEAKDSLGQLYEEQTYIDNPRQSILYLRGEANNLAGNYPNALNLFESYLNTYINTPLTNYVRLGAGWSLMHMGRLEEALNYYDAIIASDETEDVRTTAMAKLYRTIALKRMGNIEQATRELSSLSVQSAYPFPGLVLLELGQIYYEQGDYDQARRILERADRETIEARISVRVHLLLGASYVELGMWNKAASEYEIAEQISTKSTKLFMPRKDEYLAEARLKRGIALVQSHRSAEAISSLNAYISETVGSPRMDEALFWLAEAYYRSDLLTNAAETYQSLLETYANTPRREEALYGMGWAWFRQEKFDKSSRIFDKLVNEYPKSEFSIEVLTRQADGYFRMKSYSRAAETYRRAAKLAPKTEEGQYAAYQMSYALYKRGAYEDAIGGLVEFLRLYPRSPYSANAVYLMGWIRFQQKKYNEAIDHFQYLVQGYPQSGLAERAYYSIGDAYYNMGNYEEAIAAYKKVVESFPGSQLAPEAMRSIQYCYMALGRDEEAIASIDTFISSNPGSPFAIDFKMKKAEMFYTGRKYSDAIDEYRSFVNNHPQSQRSAEALYWMGKSFINMNEKDKAVGTFRELYQNFPKSEFVPLARLETALMFKNDNKVEKADSLFRKIQNDFPEHPAAAQAGFERAVVKYGLGDTTSAMAIFRNVADSYPGMEYSDQSRYRIAAYFRAKGMNDSARAEFAKLADNYDNPALAAQAQYTIGELWMRQDSCEKAIVAFEVVREKFSGYEDWYSLALLNLGECYEKTGRTEDAKEIYLALEALRPEDEFGKTATQRLKRLK